MPANNEKILTIQEAAQFLGVSTKTMRRWDQSGKLVPERTVGNQRRYTLTELEAFKINASSTVAASASSSSAPEEIEANPEIPTPVRTSNEALLINTTPDANNKPELHIPEMSYEAMVEKGDKIADPDAQKTAMPELSAEELAALESEYVAGNESTDTDILADSNNPVVKRNTHAVMMGASILGFILLFVLGTAGYAQLQENGNRQGNMLSFIFPESGVAAPTKTVTVAPSAKQQSASEAVELGINIPALFGQKVTFLESAEIKKSLTVTGVSNLNGGILTNDADIDAGLGEVTASNLIYSVLAGSNITITGDPQNPTISALVTGGVTSIQGQTGAVSLVQGTGIGLNGLTITNTGVLSLGGATGDVSLAGGSGISVSGTTITNTDPGSGQNIFKSVIAGTTTIDANSNTDSVTFAAGSGITITGDAGSKTVTITNSGAGGSLTGLTTNGVLYANSATTATTTTPGTTGTVLKGVTGGAPIFGAINLAAEVTGTLPLANGGTGINTTPTNGQLLIGNGSGYTLATITAGSGIGVSNGAGSISVTNNGVLSLTGTANQVLASGNTGAITLSLPQDIAAGSAPTFAALNLTNNTNQLTLGTGNTGVLTLGTLTSGRTYTLPDESGTVCLTSGNCSGTGGVTSTGSTNYIPKFTSGSAVGNSIIYDSGGKIGIGTTSPVGLFSVSGGAAGQALVSLNETGDQNILVGSASGTTRFIFDRTGNLNLIGGAYQSNGVSGITQAVAGCVTTTNGIVTGTGACPAANQPWDISNGAIYTGNATLDFLLGGDSTAAAKFAVTGISNGTPTASISANTSNNATYLSGDGRLGTTNMQTLTVGSASTGNVVLAPSGNTTLTALNNGGIQLNNLANCTALETNGSGLITCGSDDGGVSYAAGNDLDLTGSTFSIESTLDFVETINLTGTGTLNGVDNIDGTTASTIEAAIDTLANLVSITMSGNTITDFTGTGLTMSGNSLTTTLGTDVDLASGEVTGILGSANGGTGANLSSAAQGSVAYFSSAGVMSALAPGNAGYVLTTNGAGQNPTWTSAAGLGTNYWNRGLGALSSINITDDLLVGGNATASALFAISGTTGNASTAGSLTFNTPGVIQTTALQTLRVGSASTGNIELAPNGNTALVAYGSGVVQINNLTNCDTINTNANGALSCGTDADTTYSAGDDLNLVGTTFSLETTLDFVDTINFAGTGTINGLDAIDNTTATTIENAIDTLSNLTTTGALNAGSITNGFGAIDIGNDNLTAGGIITFAGLTSCTALETDADGVITCGTDDGGVTYSAGNDLDLTTGTFSLETTLDFVDTINFAGTGTINGLDAIDNTTATTIENAIDTLSNLTTTGALNAGSITSGFGAINIGNDNFTAGGTITLSGLTNCTALETNGSGVISCGSDDGGTSYSAGNDLDLTTGVFSLETTLDFVDTINFAGTGTINGLDALDSTSTTTIENAIDTLPNLVSLSIGGDTFDELVGTGLQISNGDLQTTLGTSVDLASAEITGILGSANGGTGANLSGATQGSIAYFSSTGVMSALAPGNAGYVLTTNGAGQNPTWTSAASLGTNYWQRNAGTLSALNITDDLLVGGNATASALFSVSGTTGNASTSGSLTFNTPGVIQTTALQTLRLGSASTGNIELSPNGNTALVAFGNGVVQINNLTNCDTINTNGNGALSCGTDADTTYSAGNDLDLVGTTFSLETTLDFVDTINFAGTGTINGLDAIDNTTATTIENAIDTLSNLTTTGALNAGSITSGFGAINIGNDNLTAGGSITFGGLTSCDTIDTDSNGVLVCGTDADTNTTYSAGNDLDLTGTTFSLETTLDFVDTINFAGTGTINGLDALDSTSATTIENAIDTLSLTSLTIGGDAFDELVGTGLQISNGDLQTTLGTSVDLASAEITGILATGNGGTGVNTIGSAGSIAYSNGSTYAFSAVGSSGQVLVSGATGAPTWADAATLGTNYWQRNLGTLSPVNITDDLLVGGTATASAKFQVFGNTGNASTSGSLTFTNPGLIQTTAMQTLTFGSSSTGNVVLSPGGNVGLTALTSGGIRLNNLTNCDTIDTDANGLLVCGTDLDTNTTYTAGDDLDLTGTTFSLETTLDTVETINFAGTGTINGLDAIDDTSETTIETAIDTLSNLTTTGALNSGSITSGFGAIDIGNDNFTAGGTITLSGFSTNNGLLYTNGSGVVSQAAAGTEGQLLIANGSGVPTFVTLSSDATVAANGTLTIANNAVALGTDTTGNYVSSLTAGSGLAVTGSAGEGWTPSVALGILTANWDQTGGFDIVLNNANSELQILESVGGTYFGTIDVGNLTGNQTYTFPDASGTVCLLEAGNCSGGAGSSKWQLNGSVLAPLTATNEVVLGGNTTTDFQFEVNGSQLGKALVSLNETGDQNILTASTSGVTKFNLANNGDFQFAGNTSFLNTFTSLATQNRTYTLPDNSGTICLSTGNCAGAGGGLTGSGTSGQIAFFNGAGTLTSETSGFAWDATNNKLGIGNDSPVGKLDISGAVVGKALTIFNETGNQDIFTASAAGNTRFTIGNNGNLTATGSLSGLTGLTSSGTITLSGLTDCDTINSNGSGVLSCGTDADTTYTAGNDLDLSGGAFALETTLDFVDTINFAGTGTINGLDALDSTSTTTIENAIDSLPNLTSLSLGGDTFDELVGTGLQISNGDLQTTLGTSVDLASAEITGILAAGNGGTGVSSVGSAGSIAYSNGSTYAFSAVGSSGQVLVSGATGAPTWADAATLGTNYWQRTLGTLAPLNITDDLLVGGTSTASAKFQIFGNTGNASSSGNLTFNTPGLIQTTAMQTLTLGSASTGNIVLSPGGNPALTALVSGGIRLHTLTNCDTINSDNNGLLSCGTDADTTYTAGNDLDLSGGAFALETTLDFVDTINLAGTGTLNGLDALDATSTTTIENAIDTLSNLTTTGALNAGSITSGFGAIDIGNDNLTAGGTITFGGLTNCTALETNGSGVISCGSDDGGTSYTAGNDLDLTTGVFSLETTLDFVDTINLAGTGTLNGLDALDNTSVTTIENAIDTLSNLTTTGALNAGSITSGFGAINIGNDNFTAGGTITLSGLTNCTALETNGSGVISCGSDDGGTSYSAGNDLDLNAGVFSLETTLDFVDTINLAGTGTLNGLDALDATSTTTIENAIDTLANLVSITISGDTITDFAGTGLQVGSGVLSTTLGVAIDTSEITDNTITGADTADDTFDFADFTDSMVLDAATSVALAGYNYTLGTNSGNGGIIVAPNAGGNAALIVNKQGDNDIFTASASGTTRFTIANNGNLTASGTLTGLTGLTSSGTITLSGLVSCDTINSDSSGVLSCGTDADTNTTYTAGNDLDLTGTTFSLETTLDFVDTINLAGTGTLNGLDALDSTSTTTIENAIDTLANLVSFTIGGDTFDELVGTGLQISNGDLQTTLGIAVDSGEITDNTITTTDLAATQTFADGDYLDLSAMNQSATAEGLRLPQATDCATNGTVEGVICWDTDGDQLLVGNGTTATVINPFGTAIDTGEITDNTITASDLAATITLADGDFIDFSAINNSSTTEGLKLPQATSCTSGTAEGQICWDTDGDQLVIGNGSSTTIVNPFGTSIDTGEITDNTITGSDTADDTFNYVDFSDSLLLDADTAVALAGFNYSLGTNSGNGGVIVAPNAGGNAALIVNKQGNNDIFTASASGTTRFTIGNNGSLTATSANGTDLFNFLTGSLKIGNGTPTNTLDGEDLYVEGGFEADGAVRFDNASITFGNATFANCTSLETSSNALTCGTDADTTYTAGNDLDLSGGAFSLETTLDFVDTINLAGTGTLNGLDALDSTSTTTIENAIDTLANLVSLSIGGDTFDELVGTGLQISNGDLQTTLGVAVDSGEITDNTITATDLAATQTFADGDYLDLSAMNQSATAEGLRLPQAADCATNGTVEGVICWDTDGDSLYVGNGSTATLVSNPFGASIDTGEITDNTITGTDTADDTFNFVDFADSLTLDASTSITMDGSEVFSLVNTGSGNSFLVEDEASTDSTPFVIDASGNVAIGATSAGAKLDVVGNTYIRGTNFDGSANGAALTVNGAYMTIGDAISGQSFTNGVGIKFNDAGVAHASIKYLTSSNRMDFCQSSMEAHLACDTNGEKLSIDFASSRVGISTTNPTAVLDVAGEASISASLKFRTGAGAIQTTANNTLSLGGDTTGNILLNSDGNNRVGVGTATPDSFMHIEGATAGDGGTNNGTGSLLHLKQTTGWTGAQPWALFVEGYSYLNGFRINGSDVQRSLYNVTQYAPLGFATNDGVITFTNGADGLQERMRIDTLGNLGIGTENPLAALDVRGTSGTKASASVSGTTAMAAMFVDNNGVGDIFTASKSGATKFVINNAGNVGIGTATPGSKLEVAGGSGMALNSSLVTLSAGNNNPYLLTLNRTDVPSSKINIWNNSGDLTVYNNSDSHIFSLSQTGLATLGTGSTGTLNINTASGTNQVAFQTGGSSKWSQYLQGNDFRFYNYTTSQDQLTLAASGTVGIGTTSPLTTLDVRGNSGTTGVASVSGTTAMAAMFVDNNGVGDIFTASKSGATKFTILNNGNVRINNLANCNTIDTDANGVLSCGTDDSNPFGASIDSSEITDNTITTTDLAATQTFADGDYLDLSAMNQSATAEGLRLPQNTDCATNGTVEGVICWDTDGDQLLVGNGTTATVINPLGTTIETGEITDNTITASDLSATLTLADGDIIDFSAINNSSTTEGLKLPQATSCTSGTAEGQICWDTDGDQLVIGNGSTTTTINPFGTSIDTGEITDDTITATDIAATTTYADGDYINLAAMNQSTTLEGLRLPQNTDCATNGTVEGVICWDTDGDQLYVGNGTTATNVTNPFGAAIDTGEITDNTITASDLNATLTFADSDLLDLSAINNSSTTEGLKLPQATSCTSGTAEGQICWDTDGDQLVIGNGSTTTTINPFGTSIDTGEITDNTITGTDTADDTFTFDDFADSMTLDAATSVGFAGFNYTLGANSGNGGLIVAPNAGGNAALIVNKQGANDIFTASAAGTTRFTIGNNGNVTNTTANGTDLFNLLTGSMKIGNGTPDNTLNGEDLYVEGGFEADGAVKLDGAVTVTDFNSITANLPANTVVSQNSSSLAQSPIAGSLWHDLLAFGKKDVPDFEHYNGSWNASSVDNDLFAQKEDQAIQILDGTTTTGARWTWNNMAWSQGTWFVLGFTYTDPAANKNILVESSADGSAWTTRHTSTGNTTIAAPQWFYVSTYGGDPYVRLTITSTNAEPVNLSSIRLMSPRWGDQGDGSEVSFPYTWDGDQNITTGGTLTTTGALTIGNLSTNGGLLYTNGSGTVSQLTAGTTGECLQANTTAAPSWGACGSTYTAGTDLDLSGGAFALETTLDSVVTINLSGTGTINGLDALDATSTTTIENAIDALPSLTTLTIGGDTITEFVGDGLSLATSTLTATLGTAITSGEITDNEITASDLNATLTFADGDYLNLSAMNQSTTLEGLRLPQNTDCATNGTVEGVICWDTDGDQLLVGNGSTATVINPLGTTIETGEITDNTITASDLSATLTLADGDIIDFSAINQSSSTEGLKLPQATACTSGTAEGLICWDTDNDQLYLGNGTTVTNVTNPFGAAIDSADITDNDITATDLNATLTFADGDYLNLSAMNQSTTLEGLRLPQNTDCATNGTVEGVICWDTDGDQLLVGNGTTATVINPLGTTIETGEITDNTITASDLSATLTLADGDIIDFSAINNSSTSEGLKLPQATSCTSGTAEGQICWDTDGDQLVIGNNATTTIINPFGTAIDASEITDNDITATDIAATTTYADGDYINLAAMNQSTTLEGLRLPQNTDCTTNGTVEGVICWDTDGDTLYVGNGATATNVTNPFGTSIDTGEITDNTITGADTADDTFNFADFADSMSLDASTEINLGANNFLFDLDSTGDFIIRDDTTAIATFTDGDFTFAPTTGKVIIGNTTNGITFDWTTSGTGMTYSGTARPTKQIVLSPEYAGGILTASASASTDGELTADASASASQSNFQTYYEWSSTETSFQDYYVAVRVTLPRDFSAWATTDALTVNYNTELGTVTSNKADLLVYNAGSTLTDAEAATPVAFLANQFTTSKTWTALSVDDSDLTDGGNVALDTAGETALIYIRMHSKDGNHVQIGDITLNYLGKF